MCSHLMKEIQSHIHFTNLAKGINTDIEENYIRITGVASHLMNRASAASTRPSLHIIKWKIHELPFYDSLTRYIDSILEGTVQGKKKSPISLPNLLLSYFINSIYSYII